jgi:phosphatidylglycerol:prolipoprotein diacylglycerol transferase
VLPTLQVGPLALQTYPLALLLAGWTGLALAARLAEQRGIQGDYIYNAGLTALTAFVLVGRLAHVVAFWPAYRLQPLEIIGINTRAFLPWPGMAAALVAGAWYVRRYRLPYRQALDAMAPGAMLAVGIASAGALLNGSMAGAPSTVPWAIPVWGVSRHPSQVYEAVAALGIVVVLLQIRDARPGTVAWAALLGYGLLRWLLEPFRAESTTVAGGLRLPQLIGLAAAVVALWQLRKWAAYPPARDEGETGEPIVSR